MGDGGIAGDEIAELYSGQIMEAKPRVWEFVVKYNRKSLDTFNREMTWSSLLKDFSERLVKNKLEGDKTGNRRLLQSCG